MKELKEEIINDFFYGGKNHTSLGCCGGDNCYEEHDEAIKIWLSLTLDKAIKATREEIIDSFCIMVKNELKQQRLDGFSLDGTDFDAVFASAKKTLLNNLK